MAAPSAAAAAVLALLLGLSACCADAARVQPTTRLAAAGVPEAASIARGGIATAAATAAAAASSATATPKPQRWNNRPIVGLLTQHGLDEDKFVPEGGTYIASSYVKFLEAGGARVVPILADTPPKVLEGLARRLNGLLIPGGAANLRPGGAFYDTAARMVEFAKRENDAGRYFPVLGICLGFETLVIIATGGDHGILRPYDSDGMAASLLFTADAPDSRFFDSWDLDLVFDVLQTPLTRESHSHGVSIKDFYANEALKGFFKPLTLSLDREGKVYVSTVEASNYPIVGLQWHPEKNAFEWTKHTNIPHGYWPVEVTHQTVRFFVNETRRSLASFDDAVDEDVWLVYNDEQIFAGRHLKNDDHVWAEEARVFPPWGDYAAKLERRAQQAGRSWLDSIKPPRRRPADDPEDDDPEAGPRPAAAAAAAL